MINEGGKLDYACCIYPTAPFLLPEYLKQGLEELQNHNAPAAISVTTFDFSILHGFKRCQDDSLAFIWPEYEYTRSQDLPEFFHDAGQFYWVNVQKFQEEKRLIMPGARPIFLPRKRVQDMNTLEDWDAAELMAEVLLYEENKR
jgi:CMP-N-acetylneuraminic acid synthetase